MINGLLKYSWPGNIRELENTLERMIVLNQDEELQLHHLPDNFLNGDESFNRTSEVVVPLRKAVEELEYRLLKDAFAKYGTTRAMDKVLDVNQSTIVRKMKQYGLDKIDDAEHHPVALEHL